MIPCGGGPGGGGLGLGEGAGPGVGAGDDPPPPAHPITRHSIPAQAANTSLSTQVFISESPFPNSDVVTKAAVGLEREQLWLEAGTHDGAVTAGQTIRLSTRTIRRAMSYEAQLCGEERIEEQEEVPHCGG